MFSREELQDIRDTALNDAKREVIFDWRHVLLQLADAAYHLDALIARREEKK